MRCGIQTFTILNFWAPAAGGAGAASNAPSAPDRTVSNTTPQHHKNGDQHMPVAQAKCTHMCVCVCTYSASHSQPRLRRPLPAGSTTSQSFYSDERHNTPRRRFSHYPKSRHTAQPYTIPSLHHIVAGLYSPPPHNARYICKTTQKVFSLTASIIDRRKNAKPLTNASSIENFRGKKFGLMQR